MAYAKCGQRLIDPNTTDTPKMLPILNLLPEKKNVNIAIILNKRPGYLP